MSFLLYKFSQSPIITFASVVYAMFALLFFGLNLHIILSVILAVISFLVIFIPIISMVYPILFTGYMVASVCIVPSEITPHHAILIFVLLLTIVRFVFMIIFAIKNPNLSKEYDTYLRK